VSAKGGRRLAEIGLSDVNDQDTDLGPIVPFIVLERGNLSEPLSMLAELLHEAGLRLRWCAANLGKYVLTYVNAYGPTVISHKERDCAKCHTDGAGSKGKRHARPTQLAKNALILLSVERRYY
jgi:hypothetical protein